MASGVLVVSFTGWAPASRAAGGALVAFCVVGQGFFGRRERLLLGVSLGLTLFGFWRDADAARTALTALDRAAFLAAFMLLLGVLRAAAQTSPAVLACGTYLTRQPPGRRYVSVALGAHMLGTMLNMGALSLLSPLIRRGVEAGRAAGDAEAVAAIKARRQYVACLRGFAWMIAWAPTTVTQALLASMFAGFDPVRGLVLGACLALLIGVAGWLEDRVRWRRALGRLRAAGGYRPPAPTRLGGEHARDFALVVLALIALSVLIRGAFAVDTVPALMLAAPILTMGWIRAQQTGPGATARTLRRGREIVAEGFPASSPEALTLACAGYIGVMTAALVPPSWLSCLTDPGGLPPVLLIWLLPLLIVLAAQIALTPIMMVSFLGSALGHAPALPMDPTVLGLALASGWALAMTASPFSAGPLIINRVAGVSAYDLSWRWNWLFSLLAYAISGGFLTALVLPGPA